MTLACGSDRSITAFDLNTCKEVLTFTDAHTRPAHIILQSMVSIENVLRQWFSFFFKVQWWCCPLQGMRALPAVRPTPQGEP